MLHVDTPSDTKRVIFGCKGLELSAAESAFFEEVKPFGFILFQRNCDTPDQVRSLCASLRAAVGWECPILIDQEGGRVQRFKPPHWPSMPSAATFGDLAKRDFSMGIEGAQLQAQILSAMLLECGVDVNCMPVADIVPLDVLTEAIGDRSYASDADIVTLLSRHFIAEAVRCGSTPVIKHLPGHGRARVDSHHDLPCISEDMDVLGKSDFMPFKEVHKLPEMAAGWGMIAHVLLSALDAEAPASLSPLCVQKLIRDDLGYKNTILVTDDLSMGALERFGSVGARAKGALDAGIDFALHCNGQMDEMLDVAENVDLLGEDSLYRVRGWLKAREKYKAQRQEKSLDDMMNKLRELLPGYQEDRRARNV